MCSIFTSLYSSPGLTLINFPKEFDDMSGSHWQDSDRKLVVAIMDFIYALKMKIAYVVRQSAVDNNSTSEPYVV